MFRVRKEGTIERCTMLKKLKAFQRYMGDHERMGKVESACIVGFEVLCVASIFHFVCINVNM
jgi:hypothetical protein